jgi:hypothetical protein
VHAVLLAAAFLAAHTGGGATAPPRTMSWTCRFDTPTRVSLSDGYTRVELQDCTSSDQPGEPRLPFRTVRLLLPPGVGGARLKATAEAPALLGSGVPEFGRIPLATRRAAASGGASAAPHPAVYGSSTPYRTEWAELVSLQRMAGYAAAVVRVFPVQYLPVRQRFTFAPTVRLDLTLLATDRTGTLPTARAALARHGRDRRRWPWTTRTVLPRMSRAPRPKQVRRPRPKRVRRSRSTTSW